MYFCSHCRAPLEGSGPKCRCLDTPSCFFCYATELLRPSYLEIGIHTEGIYRIGPARWEERWEEPRLGDSCAQW